MASPEKAIVKSWKELEDGDHLFVTRKQRSAKDGTKCYVYTHHGIYDEENGVVISFNQPSKDVKNRPPGHTEGVVSDKFQRTLRIVQLETIAIYAGLISSQIVAQHLDDFKIPDQGSKREFLVYRYMGTDKEQTKAADDPYSVDGVSPDYERNTAKATVIARWFYDNAPAAFGKYHFRSRNCEHFSTFCKTVMSDCDVSTLEKLVLKAGGGAVKKQEWKDRSMMRSLQVKRYIDGVTNLRKDVGELSSEEKEELQQVLADQRRKDGGAIVGCVPFEDIFDELLGDEC